MSCRQPPKKRPRGLWGGIVMSDGWCREEAGRYTKTIFGAQIVVASDRSGWTVYQRCFPLPQVHRNGVPTLKAGKFFAEEWARTMFAAATARAQKKQQRSASTTSSVCKCCGRRYHIRWSAPDDGYCSKHTTTRRP